MVRSAATKNFETPFMTASSLGFCRYVEPAPAESTTPPRLSMGGGRRACGDTERNEVGFVADRAGPAGSGSYAAGAGRRAFKPARDEERERLVATCHESSFTAVELFEPHPDAVRIGSFHSVGIDV